MAKDLKLSETAANIQADALATKLSGGYVKLYSGKKPSDPKSPITSQTLLATLRFASPAFGPAAKGVISALTLDPEKDAPATGTASWYRCFTADDVPMMDGTVGPTNCDMEMRANVIQQHGKVEMQTFTHDVSGESK